MLADNHSPLDQSVLLQIVKVQTEIAKLGLDLGEVMHCVTEHVRQLTQASAVIVELAEGNEMVYRAISGGADSTLGLRLARQGSLSGLCVEIGEILRCDDCETDDRVDREACRRVGVRSMVVAPLVCKDVVVGVLKIASSRPAAFTQAHVSILRLMTELIAASMYYSVKYEITELYHKATHDALTGLANRALFYDRLRLALGQARERATTLGIINLDMDGLKCINDRFGHRAGDAAIEEMARRIDRASRKADVVARLGGDEFGVIVAELRERATAEQVVCRMLGEIGRPFQFEEHPIVLRASVGFALFPDDGQDIDALIEKADKAMYQAKRAGKEREGGPVCR